MGTSFCLKCKDRMCEKNGKPCKKVEDLLQSEGIRSRDWIRPRIPHKKRGDGFGKWREIPSSMIYDGAEKNIFIDYCKCINPNPLQYNFDFCSECSKWIKKIYPRETRRASWVNKDEERA